MVTETGLLLIVAAGVIAVCAAPILYVLHRSRTRIWSLEQRLLRFESAAGLDRLARVEDRVGRVTGTLECLARDDRLARVEDRVSRVVGVLEFFAQDDQQVLEELNKR